MMVAQNSVYLVEKAKLENCEVAIEANLKNFVAVGRALSMIRDERLYKLVGFGTFEEYCKAKWGFNRARADQLIRWNQVDSSFDTVVSKPQNEAQARELLRVEPEAREETWVAAQVEFETPQPTAAEIREVREKRQPRQSEPEIDCENEDREQRLYDEIERAIKKCRAIDSNVKARDYRKLVERVLSNRSLLDCFKGDSQ